MLDSPLQNLAQRIAQTRSVDRAGKQALARELKNLRTRLHPSAAQELIDRVEAAALLMHFLATVDDGPVDALHLVARLVGTFDESCFGPPPAMRDDGGAPVPLAGGLEGLSAASKLGEILVHFGILTNDQLGEALRIQQAWRLPLGLCLEKLGHATGDQIARALELQQKLRADAGAPGLEVPPSALPAPRRPELKLGVREGQGPTLAEILVQRNQLTPHQLERAVVLQRAAGVHLGEALVQLGFLTLEQVKQAMQVQERQRR